MSSAKAHVQPALVAPARVAGSRRVCKAGAMKGQQKPKKLAKKAPQKSLKEQRAAKAAKKKAQG